jgi:hypothetical protein
MTPASPDETVAGATLKERTVGRGWQLLEPIEAAYERGEIDVAEWHRRIGAIIGPAYLAATNPRGQSGASATAAGWEHARRFIFAAVNRDGTLLDVGCANGYLMECAVAWLAESGRRIEPYGLEILPPLWHASGCLSGRSELPLVTPSSGCLNAVSISFGRASSTCRVDCGQSWCATCWCKGVSAGRGRMLA